MKGEKIMWITNEDYNILNRAINMLYSHAKNLTEEEEKIVEDVDELFDRLDEKKKKDNARCAAYIKDKRKDNPKYAGGYVKKADRQ